mmetsp:Transcript_36865/g.83132  ORF Transcript_36865/g.83132 Transcript_36865/m.83132 type:complete len:474 (+) Transcript_36865:291-1712(+)
MRPRLFEHLQGILKPTDPSKRSYHRRVRPLIPLLLVHLQEQLLRHVHGLGTSFQLGRVDQRSVGDGIGLDLRILHHREDHLPVLDDLGYAAGAQGGHAGFEEGGVGDNVTKEVVVSHHLQHLHPLVQAPCGDPFEVRRDFRRLGAEVHDSVVGVQVRFQTSLPHHRQDPHHLSKPIDVARRRCLRVGVEERVVRLEVRLHVAFVHHVKDANRMGDSDGSPDSSSFSAQVDQRVVGDSVRLQASLLHLVQNFQTLLDPSPASLHPTSPRAGVYEDVVADHIRLNLLLPHHSQDRQTIRHPFTVVRDGSSLSGDVEEGVERAEVWSDPDPPHVLENSHSLLERSSPSVGCTLGDDVKEGVERHHISLHVGSLDQREDLSRSLQVSSFFARTESQGHVVRTDLNLSVRLVVQHMTGDKLDSSGRCLTLGEFVRESFHGCLLVFTDCFFRQRRFPCHASLVGLTADNRKNARSPSHT